jgi:hypothetical protein
MYALQMQLDADLDWATRDSSEPRSTASHSSDVPACWLADNRLYGLSREDFLQARMRWCPSCLREQGYIRREWRLKLCCVCTRHACLLRDRCQACGAPQRMERGDLLRCLCGARLDAGEQPGAACDLVDLTAFMANAVFERNMAPGFPSETASGTALSTPSGPPFGTPAQWFKLVRYLGAFASSARPARAGQAARLDDLAVAATYAQAAARILGDWPLGLHALLRDAAAKQDNTASLARAFGPIYAVLYRRLASPCFQFLRDAFETYLHDNWWGLLCKRNRSLQQSTIQTHPRMSLGKVAGLSRTDVSTTTHFVHQGLLVAHETLSPKGRRFRTIHAQMIGLLASNAAALVCLDEAARLLALPAERVLQLLAHEQHRLALSEDEHRANGTPPPTSAEELTGAGSSHQAGTRWKIKRATLAAWRPAHQQVHAGISVKTASVRKAARDLHLSGFEFCTLVHAVCRGDLVASELEAGASALGDLMLDVAAVRRFITGMRRPAFLTMSVDEAARMLGLKQQVVYGLVRTGLLQSHIDAAGHRAEEAKEGPRKTRGGRRICTQDIAQFRSTYVALADIARGCSESPRAWMQGCPLLPVCGPTLNGVRQYFYLRCEVDAWQAGTEVARTA